MKSIFFLFLFFLLLSLKSLAAITVTFDAKSSSKSDAASSLTFSHTTGTGSDRILIVGVTIQFPGTTSINSVTYNGTNLTYKDGQTTGTLGVEMWYLTNPAAGAHNVVINLSGSTVVTGGAQSFYNVHQTTPFGTIVKAGGNGTTASAVVSTSSANEIVVDAVGSGTNALTVGAGQTQDYNQATTTWNNGGGSREAGTGGNVTMSWTIGSSDSWAIVAGGVKPAAVLPITLFSFNADCIGDNKVEINWTTFTEKNNDYFTIEKSENNTQFDAIAIIQGAGNSNTQKKYKVFDYLKNGTCYYRLKQTDFNGLFEYFPVVAVQDCASPPLNLQVFLTLESNATPMQLIYKLPEAGEIKIKICTLLGELVEELKSVRLESGTYNYTPFLKEKRTPSQNYIALFEYRSQITTCHFIN